MRLCVLWDGNSAIAEKRQRVHESAKVEKAGTETDIGEIEHDSRYYNRTILSGKKHIAQTRSESKGGIHPFIPHFIISVSEYSGIYRCDRISCDGGAFVKSTNRLHYEGVEADHYDFDADGCVPAVFDKRR